MYKHQNPIIEKVFNAIEDHSLNFKSDPSYRSRALASARNFVCTPDLVHWTFGKSVGYDGEYHSYGGAAASRLTTKGFDSIYGLEEFDTIRVEESFKDWAQIINKPRLIELLDERKSSANPIELYIHRESFLIENLKDKKQEEFDEGHKKEIAKEISVRNNKLVKEAKSLYGTTCTVCVFNFGDIYGEHGEGFIEVHHLYPIANGERVSKVEDVRPVCANCHRMLHRGAELLSIAELKEIIKRR